MSEWEQRVLGQARKVRALARDLANAKTAAEDAETAVEDAESRHLAAISDLEKIVSEPGAGEGSCPIHPAPVEGCQVCRALAGAAGNAIERERQAEILAKQSAPKQGGAP